MVCCYDFVVAGGMRLYVVLKCGLKCRGGIDMWSASVPRSNFYQLLQIRFLGMVMITNCQMAYSSWDAIAGVIPDWMVKPPCSRCAAKMGTPQLPFFFLRRLSPPISIPISTFLTLLHGAAHPRARKAPPVHGPRWISTCGSSTAGGWIGIGKESMKDSGLIYITLHYIPLHSIPFHCIALHYTTYILYIYVYIIIYIYIESSKPQKDREVHHHYLSGILRYSLEVPRLTLKNIGMWVCYQSRIPLFIPILMGKMVINHD